MRLILNTGIGHYFRTTHCPLALSVLALIGLRYCHFLYFCIIFFNYKFLFLGFPVMS